MQNPFDNFSSSDFQIFLEKYYSGNVQSVLNEYGISITPAKISEFFPKMQTEEACPNCSSKMLEKVPSKVQKMRHDPIIRLCGVCDHINEDFCLCNFCTGKRIQFHKDRLNKINIYIDRFFGPKNLEKVIFEEKSFKEKIVLSALVSDCIEEDLVTISPTSLATRNFSPTLQLSTDILKLVKDSELLRTSPESSYFLKILDFSKAPEKPNFFEFSYFLNVTSKEFENKNDFITYIINGIKIKEYEKEKALELWREINAHEGIAYMHWLLKDLFGHIFPIGSKTYNVFMSLSKEYSIGQIYNLIYQASKNVLFMQKKNRMDNFQAARSILNQIINSSSRYKANSSWEIKSFSRNYDLPESLLSAYFFTRVLHLSNNGMDTVPSLQYIEELNL